MNPVAQPSHKPQTKEAVTSPAFRFLQITTVRELKEMQREV